MHIALLRAINVGGHKPIRMADLRESLAALGFDPIATYLQSGNAVFGAKAAKPAALPETIQKRLLKDFGQEIEVHVSSAKDMQRVIEGNPFAAQRGVDPTKLHVTFLFQAPAPAGLKKLESVARGKDEYRVIGGVVYLHCPEGYGNSKLANPNLERALAVRATTRNWRTVNEVCRMAVE